MGVFFNPLFKKMSEEGISQSLLREACHISSLTFAQMRRGECVPLESLAKICEYLECDFGDIMTIKPPEPSVNDPIHFTNNIKECIGVFRVTLQDYMSEAGLSVKNVSDLTGLSLNTVKQILKGSLSVSSVSCFKLFVLGKRYNQIFNKYGEMFRQGIEIPIGEEKDDYAISKIIRHYLDDEVSSFLSEYLQEKLCEENVSKAECAKKLGISINTFYKVLNEDILSQSTVTKLCCSMSDETLKQLSDLIDDESPERRREIYRSYSCDNCRAFNYSDNSCYLQYQNIMGEDGKYHSAEPCSHPRTFTLFLEEANDKNIDIAIPDGTIWVPRKIKE